MKSSGIKHSLWKLSMLLAPFATAAVATKPVPRRPDVSHIGIPALSQLQSLIWAIPLGVLATWAAALRVRHLIAEAET